MPKTPASSTTIKVKRNSKKEIDRLASEKEMSRVALRQQFIEAGE